MKEISEILKRLDAIAANESAVLATVVDLKGSGYRLPGARMLIEADGNATGTVSGGCLEADVLVRAARVLASRRAEVFTYDTTAEENSVFSLNMGCRGVLRILLEPVGRSSEIVRAFRDAYTRRKRFVTATVIDKGASTAVAVGTRMIMVEGTDEVFGEPAAALRQTGALKADLATFAGSTSYYETNTYLIDGARIEFAFESIRPPVALIILGAGADAVPLAEAAHALGWHVKVVDHRPAFLTPERFESADELVTVGRGQEPDIDADDLTAIVVMNHNYERDKAMLTPALRTDAFYVGALGPKKRTAQILEELGIAEDLSERLRSPAGLDIGADTPETIAVSIIAEIQSVLRSRTGGALKHRDAPIYDRK